MQIRLFLNTSSLFAQFPALETHEVNKLFRRLHSWLPQFLLFTTLEL